MNSTQLLIDQTLCSSKAKIYRESYIWSWYLHANDFKLQEYRNDTKSSDDAPVSG